MLMNALTCSLTSQDSHALSVRLQVGLDVNVRLTTKSSEQPISLAALLDMSTLMASTCYEPGGHTPACSPSHLEAAIQATRCLVEELPETSILMLATMGAQVSAIHVCSSC
jgi:hypothetical protein